MGELKSHIQDICEIPGYEHVYRDIIYIDRKTSFLAIPVVDTRVLFAVDIRIQAGIDLSAGFEVEQLSRNAVKVSLPPAGILLADADEDSIEQYFIKEYGDQVSRLDYYDEIERKKGELIDDAIRRGILDKAEENVRKIIENFLQLSGYTTVVFEEFRPPEASRG
ncbi:MAG: DUF4230 domain-containing protein [Spirochaetales bacterium]|nr:DUF4230 domain-containing protein [Spirochaetales bacterium]